MKLKDCTYGKLVIDGQGERVGMIKGITNNATHGNTAERDNRDNAIPLVEWSGGHTCGIHHGNTKELK